jgi:hypothetical protein
MEHADTNQGFIGIMNRRSPVLMIAKSVKKKSLKPRIQEEEELYQLTLMGMNP